jgi:hypothetical protein
MPYDLQPSPFGILADLAGQFGNQGSFDVEVFKASTSMVCNSKLSVINILYRNTGPSNTDIAASERSVAWFKPDRDSEKHFNESRLPSGLAK